MISYITETFRAHKTSRKYLLYKHVNEYLHFYKYLKKFKTMFFNHFQRSILISSDSFININEIGKWNRLPNFNKLYGKELISDSADDMYMK